jgi:hypothetical protein
VTEQEDRRFYYFYNENSTHTSIDDRALFGKGLDEKIRKRIEATYEWYSEHLQQVISGPVVYLLTTRKSMYPGIERVIDVNDFVLMYRDKYPELDNFLGFVEEDMDVEMVDEDVGGLFESHLELSQILLGVKEGKYFQGRLNVSRLTLAEATINVQGLTQDILI